MVHSGAELSAERSIHKGTSGEFPAVLVRGQGESLRVLWAIGLHSYLAVHRGAFITEVNHCASDAGFALSGRTDESSTARVEYGPNTDLGEALLIPLPQTWHTASLPDTARYFRIVAIDQHGDDSASESVTAVCH